MPKAQTDDPLNAPVDIKTAFLNGYLALIVLFLMVSAAFVVTDVPPEQILLAAWACSIPLNWGFSGISYFVFTYGLRLLC